jgi:hypothetical protein
MELLPIVRTFLHFRTNEQHIKVLMSVKEALLEVEENSENITLLVDRSDCIIKFLNDQNVSIPGLEEALRVGRAAWEKILRESPQVTNPCFCHNSLKLA